MILPVDCTFMVLQECAPAISKGASHAAVYGINLEAAQHSWLDSESMILTLRSGQLVSVHLKSDGTKVASIQVLFIEYNTPWYSSQAQKGVQLPTN